MKGVPASASAGSRTTAADVVAELLELAEELVNQAGDATSPDEVAARWEDTSARRSLFDRAIVGRLSVSDDSYAVVDYLISCYARVGELRSRKSSMLTPELADMYSYVTDLCVSYASIALLYPTMFPQPADVDAEGVLRLLRPLKADSLPQGFLSSLCAWLQEEGTLTELGLPLYAKLAEEVGDTKFTILTDFTPAYRALNGLVREKPLGALLATDPNFLGGPLARNGALLQMGARLGPFLGLAVFPYDPALAAACFPDTSSPAILENSMSSLRLSTGVVQRALTNVAKELLKNPEAKELLKNPEAKEPFFKPIVAACSLNQSRAQQWFPPSFQTSRRTSRRGAAIHCIAVTVA
jgi:hypothetical protein